MKVRASELKPGEVIRIEYGAEGNWVNVTISEVTRIEKMVILKGEACGISINLTQKAEELMEVINEN